MTKDFVDWHVKSDISAHLTVEGEEEEEQIQRREFGVYGLGDKVVENNWGEEQKSNFRCKESLF